MATGDPMGTRPTRVLHVVQSLQRGGTERRLLRVVESLDPQRFDVGIACIDELGALAEEARALGVDPVLIGRHHRIDVRGLLRIAALMRRERTSIVHGWLSLPNIYARLGGTLAGVPVRIAAEGGTLISLDRHRVRLHHLVDRTLSPLTDAYVANSRAVADGLRDRGFAPPKVVVIPNGVEVPQPLDERERGRLRLTLGAAQGESLIGMVARVDAEFKDHHTFLETAAALRSEGLTIRPVIVGDGPGRADAEAVAGQLGLAGVAVFAGYRDDAPRLLQALDVSVLLTYSEGFSNVVLESMAAGTPLVATDIPSNREALEHNVHGLLVPIGDATATAAAIRRLLADPALGRGLASSARERVARCFSLAAQAESVVALYESLLRARARGR
jgi:glycosyltransferase involved in cell wall biosynthesis